MAGPAVKADVVRGLNCPSCGAAIELRGLAWTQTVACASCGAVLDARDPNFAILSRFDARMKVKPLIPLGARGEWKGATHQVIGFQQRTIRVEGVAYSWREYVLFNPYRGFRYLTEYDGHWNDVVPLAGHPVVSEGGAKPTAEHEGRTYTHFQHATAETTFVAGEFPWEVRAGDKVGSDDFVSPPFVLSAEHTPEETTWSHGEYADPRAIWKAFRVPGAPPGPSGVYANQPSPYRESAASYWKLFGLFAVAMITMMILRVATARNARVFSDSYTFEPVAGQTVTAPAFVTPTFELPGGRANVEVETSAPTLDQGWLYVEYALVNEATGQAWDFAREVSRYSGRDSDGAWSEGSRNDDATIGPVPGGRYFLRVETSGAVTAGDMPPAIPYRVVVRRDVPSIAFFMIGLLVLLTPPVFGALQAASFEQRRWAESDYAPSDGSDDDE